MNFFQKLFFKPVLAELKSEIGYDTLRFQNALNLSVYNSLQFADYSGDAIQNISVVYQAINVLSNTLARIPVSIVKDVNGDGDYEEYKEQYWYVPVRFKPNSYTSDYELKRLIATAVYLKGNAYLYKNRSANTLEFIHPDCITDIVLVNGYKFYRSNIKDDKGQGYVFNQDEILHFKNVGNLVYNGLKGVGALDSLRITMNLLNLAERTTEEYYRNGARSPLVIERDIDKSVNQESLNELIAEVQQKNLSGRFSIREPLILPPTLRAKELKLTAEDTAFVSTAQFSTETIANAFGLPSYLVYSSKGSLGKYEQESIAFKNTTLANYLEMYVSVLNDSLLSLEDRININATVQYDINKLNDLDFATLASQAVQLSNNAIITKNEARKMIKLKRYDHDVTGN